MKLEKSSLLQLLSHFSLSTMHEVVGESILPNTFFQNSSASSRNSLIKLFSKKTALLVKLSCAKQTLNSIDFGATNLYTTTSPFRYI